VLALLGICTFNLTALPAIICGIIGMVKIHGSNGRLKGKGFAISGIVIPVVLFILLCAFGMLASIMMPAMTRARQVAQYTLCTTKIKSLGVSMSVYVQDYNSYPPADKWVEELTSKEDVAVSQLLCPADAKQEGLSSYAFNTNLSGVNPANVPSDTVLLFETTAGVNPVGGAEILNTERHQNEGCNVLFADGSARFVKKEEFETLKWKP
jgi:prepilin-type processing-associated H-X9-DG protein